MTLAMRTAPAQEMVLLTTSGLLTPSEVVFLTGDTFVAAQRWGELYRIPGNGAEVPLRPLILTTFAAAFLAEEEAGNLRLEAREVQPGSEAMGYHLYAEAHGYALNWPPASLEAEISKLARQARARLGESQVARIVQATLGGEHEWPFFAAADTVLRGLVERELAEAYLTRILLLIPLRQFRVPAATVEMARPWTATVQDMLARCQDQRPEVWQLLVAEVRSGIQAGYRLPFLYRARMGG